MLSSATLRFAATAALLVVLAATTASAADLQQTVFDFSADVSVASRKRPNFEKYLSAFYGLNPVATINVAKTSPFTGGSGIKMVAVDFSFGGNNFERYQSSLKSTIASQNETNTLTAFLGEESPTFYVTGISYVGSREVGGPAPPPADDVDDLEVGGVSAVLIAAIAVGAALIIIGLCACVVFARAKKRAETGTAQYVDMQARHDAHDLSQQA